MKKTIALFLAVALLGVGLIASCSDDPEPAKEPPAPVVKFKVSFDSDGRPFKDGTTAIKVVEVEKDKTVGSNWPEIDDGKIGTDDLQGWFDGATQVTRSTPITKDVTFKAKFEAALFTFDNAVNSATHTNFVITVSASGKHGSWDFEGTETSPNNNKDEGGNKFVITNGGIQYRYPVTYNFDYKDYDFVDVEYTASDVNSLVLKQYDSTDGYQQFAGSIANTAEGEKKIITWEVRQAVPADPTKPELPVGFAIQKYSAGSADTTIQITGITFRKGTRYKIKFDTNGGTPATIADSYLVDGTKVSNYLPADVKKTGFVFAGWLNGLTAVGSDTTVTNSLNNVTLKAFWLADLPTLTSKTITFSSGLTEFKFIKAADQNDDAVVTALTGDDATKGFSITKLNYEWRIAAFKVTLPASATLAHYDKIEFFIDQTSSNYKNIFVAAAPSTGAGAFAAPSSATYIGSKAVTNTIASGGTNTLTMSFTINKPAAAGLTGDVDICIAIPAGASATYIIKNIVFVKGE